MPNLGYVGAGGQAGGWQALADIIARRREEEILNEKKYQFEREQVLREEEARQRAEEFRATNQRLIRGEERDVEQQKQATLDKLVGRITENTPIGAQLGIPQIAALHAGGLPSTIKATPITQAPGLVEQVGTAEAAPPTGLIAGGETVYGGTFKQQRDEAKAALDEARYQATVARDAESQRLAQDRLNQAERHFQESQARLSGQFGQMMSLRGQLSPAQELVQTRQLANDYVRQSTTFKTMDRQLQNMQSALTAAKQGKRLASDESIIVSWERMLDPNSVVREGEYARVGGGAPILNRMTEIVRRAREGGSILNIGHLQELTDLAAQFTENARVYNDANRERIGRIADQYGLDRRQIFPDEPGAQPGVTPGVLPPAAQPATAGTPAAAPDFVWNPATRKLEPRK